MTPEGLKILASEIIAEFKCSPEMGESIARYMLGEDDDVAYDYLYDRFMEKMLYSPNVNKFNSIAGYLEDKFGHTVRGFCGPSTKLKHS